MDRALELLAERRAKGPAPKKSRASASPTQALTQTQPTESTIVVVRRPVRHGLVSSRSGGPFPLEPAE